MGCLSADTLPKSCFQTRILYSRESGLAVRQPLRGCWLHVQPGAPSFPVSLRGAGGDVLTIKNNVPAQAVTRCEEGPRGQAVAEAPPGYPRPPQLSCRVCRVPSGCQADKRTKQQQDWSICCLPSRAAWARAPQQAPLPLRPQARVACPRGALGLGPGGRPALSHSRGARWGLAVPHEATGLASSPAEAHAGLGLPSFSHVLFKALNS